MLRSLQKCKCLIDNDTVDRGGQARKGKRHVGTLSDKQLNLIAKLPQLVKGCILDLIKRDKQTPAL